MDLNTYIGQWQGKEVVAFCGATKYRGTLSGALDGGFLVLSKVAVVNPGSEAMEYENCVLNIGELSGLACEEFSSRRAEDIPEV